MKKLLTILICLLTACHSHPNTHRTDEPAVLPIYLQELNYWDFNPKIDKTITQKLSDTSIIKINVKSNKGALSFEIYNLENELVKKGSYCNALDIFKHYSYLFDVSNERDSISVKEHYQPLPDGIWTTFSKGKIVDKVRYSKGFIKFDSSKAKQ